VQLDWSTILLEIVNFLVLVWILKRFLYKPVLDIIAKRRTSIESTVAKSESMKQEAEALKEQYESRLADWEQERAKARETLRDEMEAERVRLHKELDLEIQNAREKARVADERRLLEAQRLAEQHAVTQGARFAARLVGSLSGPELDARLVQKMLEELQQFPGDRIATLRQQAVSRAEVMSARVLDESTRQAIGFALGRLFGHAVDCQYHEDSTLLAGVRITIGPWILRANFKDELQGFVELSHESTAE